MEKQIEKFVTDFEKQVRNALENFIIEILNDKNANAVKTMLIGVNKQTFEVCTTEKEFDENVIQLSSYSSNRQYIIKKDQNNSKLYASLSQQEKSAYLLRQQFYLENGDFVYYDLDTMLFEYVRSMFADSFNKYAKSIAKKIATSVTSDDTFNIVRNNFIKVIKLSLVKDEALDRVKSERDELRERREKLYQFIEEKRHLKLNAAQQSLLPLQLDYMTSYLNVLNSRIEHWFDENTEETTND